MRENRQQSKAQIFNPAQLDWRQITRSTELDNPESRQIQ